MRLAQKTFYQQSQSVLYGMYDKVMSDESILLDMTVFRRFVIHRSAFFCFIKILANGKLNLRLSTVNACIYMIFRNFFFSLGDLPEEKGKGMVKSNIKCHKINIMPCVHLARLSFYGMVSLAFAVAFLCFVKSDYAIVEVILQL